LHVTELLGKIARSGMVFVDIGANLGWYTLLLAKKVGPTGSVISFEAAPSNYAFLQKSVLRNRLTNIVIRRECVAAKAGTRILYLTDGDAGGHSLIEIAGSRSVQVPATTLDIAAKELGLDQIDILKIDTEGAEPEVVEGGLHTLSHTDKIVMEWRANAWRGREDLLQHLFSEFEFREIVRSPLLLKNRDWKRIWDLPLTNLYLRKL